PPPRARADARARAAARARAVLVVMHAVARQRHQLEEGRAAVEQKRDALAWHELRALGEARARLLRRRLHAGLGGAELGDGQKHLLAIALVVVAVAVDLAFEDRHGQPPSTLGVLARWKPLKGCERSVVGSSIERLPSGTPPSMRISVPVM